MKTTIKNISLIAIGAILASTITLYAATIEANINSFTQYLQNLFITTDGTPTGDPIFMVSEDGQLQNNREGANGSAYAIANIADGLGPSTEFVGIGAFDDTKTSVLGIANIFGFNQILLNSVNEQTRQESFFTAIPGQISIINQINSNIVNGISLADNGINIDIANTGEFIQNRHDFRLTNTPALFGQVPFAGSVYETGTQAYIAGVADLFGSPLAVLEYFDQGNPLAFVAVGSGIVTIEAAGKSIFIDQSGIRINNEYTLPAQDGQAGQVLSTDGNGNLTWIHIIQ